MTYVLEFVIGLVVGDGTKINFWHDLWCGDTTLKVAFPSLFGIAYVKDAAVVDNLEFLGGSNQWNVSFTREVNVFASFFQALHSVKCEEVVKTRCGGSPPKKVC